jgi:ornithine carbamoyltransferase
VNDLRHFLDLSDCDGATLRHILDLAARAKRGEPMAGRGDERPPLAGKTLALIFEKPSTRTRVSFEVGMRQLGGEVVVLTEGDTQLGRGETLADTARVLSRYVDAIMLRTTSLEHMDELSCHATVPVINGLTNRSHPCQLLADIMTFEEHRGPIAGKRIAWCGDGTNVATSWVEAAARFDFELRLACPASLAPPREAIEWARGHGGRIELGEDARAAVAGADCVVTDTWMSMGVSGGVSGGCDEPENRHNLLASYQVDDKLMGLAKEDAIFMHCLPAHRGEEVTASVIDGPRSVVWDEAENRLHAQKGILLWCLG